MQSTYISKYRLENLLCRGQAFCSTLFPTHFVIPVVPSRRSQRALPKWHQRSHILFGTQECAANVQCVAPGALKIPYNCEAVMRYYCEEGSQPLQVRGYLNFLVVAKIRSRHAHTQMYESASNTAFHCVYAYFISISNLFDPFKNIFHHCVYLTVCTVPEFRKF
jgi:hypothetical protein